MHPAEEPPRSEGHESMSALWLTWFVAPLIAIGIGLLAGALALVGLLTALCSSIIGMPRLRSQARSHTDIDARSLGGAAQPVI